MIIVNPCQKTLFRLTLIADKYFYLILIMIINALICGHLESIIHCYQVNDCSNKILVIKGGAHFLRYCWKMAFVTER